MARTKISEFSATPGNNTDIDGINIAEGCAPSGINDAIRELMSQLKDFQAGTAGDSFNGPVGTTTAAAGAFTTLSASSTVSGTGFSNYLASPPAIGGTAAAAGSFTTLSASSTVTLSGGTANGVLYLNGSKVATSGSALTFDGTNFATTGNVTAGTTSVGANIVAYASSYGANGLIRVFGTDGLNKGAFNASSATTVTLNARSGVSIIFEANDTEQMRLTSTGLGIGTSSPTSKLSIGGGLDFKSYIAHADNFALYANSTDGTTLAAYTGYPITFRIANSEKMRLDTSGNLGLGVTPSGWGTNYTALQVGNSGTTGSFVASSSSAIFGQNMYRLNTGVENYIYSTQANKYAMDSGGHKWYTAASGTAGNTISFTQAMTLDASGNLAVGGTSVYAATITSYGSASRSGGLGIRNSAGTAAGGIYTYAAGSGGGSTDILVEGVNSLQFYTNSAERARIDSSGNLGIGTSSPSEKLTVAGKVLLSVSAPQVVLNRVGTTFQSDIKFQTSGTNNWSIGQALGAVGSNLEFYDYGAGVTRMQLDTSGNLGLGVTPSAWSGLPANGVLQMYGGSLYTPPTGGQDSIGLVSNAHYNGTNWIYKATSNATRYEQYAGIHRWYNAPSGTAGNAITFTQAMTLDASGQLAIGRTSASATLDIEASGGASTYWRRTGFSNRGTINVDGTNATLASEGALLFGTGSGFTERARIDSSGNLLVGTTSVLNSGKFSLYQTNNSFAAVVQNTSSSVSGAYGIQVNLTQDPNTTDSFFYKGTGNATDRFYVRANGGIGNYQANDVNLSDRREKTDFASAKSYLETICAIPVQTFKYIDQTDNEKTLGVVAQDVQAVAPELVSESNWGTEEDPKMRLSIYQTDLQYALMKCIQELKAEVDSLKTQLKGA